MFTHCLVDVHPSVGHTQINSGGGVVKVVLILSAGIDAGVDAAQNCGRDIRAAFA
jgi:hypothetical protein